MTSRRDARRRALVAVQTAREAMLLAYREMVRAGDRPEAPMALELAERLATLERWAEARVEASKMEERIRRVS